MSKFKVLFITTSLILLTVSIATAQQAVTRDLINQLTGREAPQEIQQEASKKINLNRQSLPFGNNLFKGRFVTERENGLNPGYTIQQGDQINLRIWGAATYNDMVTVDAQGNIFIPEVGPIHVEGITNNRLNAYIRNALREVYTQNVNVYTNLASATPVIVFVTGYVKNPGSYAGIASDSVLYFLDRAGGIDYERGSFIDISILRNGEEIDSINLYDFLLNGTIPKPQFVDGDTILVKQRKSSLTVKGSARNTYNFEIPDAGISGDELISMARPYPNSYYATVVGTRGNEPFSKYLPLDQLSKQTFRDGDEITFEIDQFNDTMLIRVEGSHTGQSRFAVPRNTTLKQMLDYIQVDPELSDISAISLKRESIRIRQAQAIKDSLNRLETAVLSKQSVTQAGADIALKEGQMIQDFVKRAREIKPEGILVVSHNGDISDILLQPDDIITIPDKTNVVQVSGEVSVPQALVYRDDLDMKGYINLVGGYTARADESKHLIIRRTGEVIPLFKGQKHFNIKPGDEIIAMPKVPSKNVEIVQLITETMFRIASAAAIFLRL